MDEAPGGAGGSNQTGLKLLVGCGCLTMVVGGASLLAFGIWSLSRSPEWDKFAAFVGAPGGPKARPLSLAEARVIFPIAATVGHEAEKKLDKGDLAAALKIDCRLSIAMLILFQPGGSPDVGQTRHAVVFEGRDPRSDPELLAEIGRFTARDVVGCDSRVNGDSAGGVLHYKTKYFFGRVNFAAKRVDGLWRVESFTFPESGLRIERRNGKETWKRVDGPEDAPLALPAGGVGGR